MSIPSLFEVRVSGWFSASHRLRLAGGELEPLHGHNWHVSVTFEGPRLNEWGVLIDFVAARAALQALLAELHDRHLNDLPTFDERNPSAENVAVFLAERLSGLAVAPVRLARVTVEEAPGCVACYSPPAA